MKFLIDMNLSPRWANVLRSNNFEAVHWSEVGRANASDHDVLAWASEHNFIVITADLDFPAILAATGKERPSVVLLRGDDLSPERLAALFLDAYQRGREDLESGAILTIDALRSRIRLLPLKP